MRHPATHRGKRVLHVRLALNTPFGRDLRVNAVKRLADEIPHIPRRDLPLRDVNERVKLGGRDGYVSRWRVEDTIRYVKQAYKLEDVRLMKYVKLRNMAARALTKPDFATQAGFSPRKMPVTLLKSSVRPKTLGGTLVSHHFLGRLHASLDTGSDV